MDTRWIVLVVALLIGCFGARASQPPTIVGVNAVNPLRASVADQNALIAQLKGAHVRVIRCGISNDAKGIDFAKRA